MIYSQNAKKRNVPFAFAIDNNSSSSSGGRTTTRNNNENTWSLVIIKNGCVLLLCIFFSVIIILQQITRRAAADDGMRAMLMYTCSGLKCNPHSRIHNVKWAKTLSYSMFTSSLFSIIFQVFFFFFFSPSLAFSQVLEILLFVKHNVEITFIHFAFTMQILTHGRRNISRIYLVNSNTKRKCDAYIAEKKSIFFLLCMWSEVQ